VADRKIAGLAMPTVIAIGSGVLLWFVLARMFPRIAILVRGEAGMIRT